MQDSAEKAIIHTISSDDDSPQFANDVVPLIFKQKRPGYVYLLSAPNGFYKIGRSKDVPTRFNTLKIQLPFDVELVHKFYTIDYVAVELSLHEQFAHCRKNGEWFELTDEDVSFIKCYEDDAE